MIVIVCGGRDYADADFVFQSLDRAAQKKKIDVVFEGGADGADSLARKWALDRGVQCVTIHANWKKHGVSAGPKRNALMLTTAQASAKLAEDECGVIAFSGGKGTANMIGQAEKNGVKVWKPTRGQDAQA